MKVLRMFLAAALLAAASTGPALAADDELATRIAACTREKDDALRLACFDRVCDLPLWIDIQGLRNVRPAATENTRRVRPQQIGEFLIYDAEVRIGISLPNKAEGKMVRVHCRCRKIRFW